MNFFRKIGYRLRYEGLSADSDVRIIGNCQFENETTLNSGVIIKDSSLKRYSYVNYNSIINVTNIGRFTSIGPNVVCGLGSHPTRHFLSTSPATFLIGKFTNVQYDGQFLPVEIGNDVWIGANVTIVNGVRIGDGAIIGANSVVIHDVPAYAVYGGVPAKLMRYRFSEKMIVNLLEDAWWEMKDNEIKIYLSNFDGLLACHE